MKRITTVLAIMISLMATSQIEVNQTKTERLTVSATNSQILTTFIKESDTTYAFYYKNAKYKTLTDIKYFSLADRTEVLTLFDLIQQSIEKDEEFNITLSNGEQMILGKSLGKCLVWTKRGYFYIGVKEVNKINEYLNK